MDFDPICAGMAEMPEESDYSSIQQRGLEEHPKISGRQQSSIEALPEDLRAAIGCLMPLSDQAPKDAEGYVPYQIQDCLEVADGSSRAIIEGKCGNISDDLRPILDRLKIDLDNYVRFIDRTQKNRVHVFIISVESMQGQAADFIRSFLKGQSVAVAQFSPG